MLPVGLGIITWFRRVVLSNTGAVVTSVQLELLKSGVCCRIKFADGRIQETTRLLLVGLSVSRGVGVDWQVYTRPAF